MQNMWGSVQEGTRKINVIKHDYRARSSTNETVWCQVVGPGTSLEESPLGT